MLSSPINCETLSLNYIRYLVLDLFLISNLSMLFLYIYIYKIYIFIFRFLKFLYIHTYIYIYIYINFLINPTI